MDPLAVYLLTASAALACVACGWVLARGTDSVTSWLARRDRLAAKQYREDGHHFREEARWLRGVWDEAWNSSEHALHGRRLAEHCDMLKAERDQARAEADEWSGICREHSEALADALNQVEDLRRRASAEESWPEDWIVL